MEIIKEDRKLSVYFPRTMLSEINQMAQELDRSRSWILQKAWQIAKEDLQQFNGPYPEHLIQKFESTVAAISKRTAHLSEEEIEQAAVKAVKKVRKTKK